MANDGGSSDNRRDRFVPAIPVNAIYQINPPRTWTAIGSRSRARYQHNVRFASGRYSGFDSLQSVRKAARRFATSCLRANLLGRLRGTGVTVNCLHPGFVATRFGDQSGGLISHLSWFAKFFAISPAKGAETIIYLASARKWLTRGQYFYKYLPIASSSLALGGRLASMLWQRSAALAEPRMAGD
jgi:hypothetical protein